MKRRELLAMGIAATMTTGLSAAARGASRSWLVNPDQDAAFIYDENRQFLSTKFGRIAYIDRGVGAVVLFLHGFPLNGFQWRGVIDEIVPQRRCIALDLMGLGYSEVAVDQDVSPNARQRRRNRAAVSRKPAEAGAFPVAHELRRRNSKPTSRRVADY
jgi:haloalkane dehalogenase